MSLMDACTPGFVASARAGRNRFQSLDDTRHWLQDLQENHPARVRRIPLAEMEQWYFDAASGDLRHRSGRFFSIIGLDCRPARGAPWQQPVILQPEVGILGILTKDFDGVRYLLMQAKMEPGNINKVQLSPTLQATYSNYTQAHRGALPPYLEYFLDEGARVIRSQLQSETGTRFLGKFNRNVLVDVRGDIDPRPGFRWLTLHEIQCLMAVDDAVNMDARSVLSNIAFSGAGTADGATAFFRSASRGADAASLHRLRAWLSRMRERHGIATRRIPLNAVEHWVRGDWDIRHRARNYFSVAGVRVEAGGREVAQWCQPLLRHDGLGLAGFLCAEIDGVLHFLMQAKPEPGIAHGVELGPTVSAFDYQRRAEEEPGAIPYIEYFLQPRDDARVLHASIQSEEGGRFWNLRNRFLVVEAEDARLVPIRERYAWMTLAQLQQLSQGESRVNSEARTLLSCLKFFE